MIDSLRTTCPANSVEGWTTPDSEDGWNGRTPVKASGQKLLTPGATDVATRDGGAGTLDRRSRRASDGRGFWWRRTTSNRITRHRDIRRPTSSPPQQAQRAGWLNEYDSRPATASQMAAGSYADQDGRHRRQASATTARSQESAGDRRENHDSSSWQISRPSARSEGMLGAVVTSGQKLRARRGGARSFARALFGPASTPRRVIRRGYQDGQRRRLAS